MQETAEGIAGRRSGVAYGVRRRRPRPRRQQKAPSGPARTAVYDRARDLPGLIPLWPWEIEDSSVEAQQRLVTLLRRALRRERKRGIGCDWTYDVVRHARLLAAYKCEVASLKGKLASRKTAGRFGPAETRV